MISNIPHIKYTDKENFFLLAGPCVIESKKLVFEIVKKIEKITDKLKIPWIFKASYRKANRSSVFSFTGIGDRKALQILQEVGNHFAVPLMTDIHSVEEAAIAAQYVDVLQIPAFLCRQTDLLQAAAKTGKYVNIKKGQFLSAESMKFAVEKVRQSKNNHIIITERGTTFGYQDLIVDFRGIPELKKNKCPVVLDVTHSLQQPNQKSGITGGNPELIETIAKAGIAVGVDGVFIETHPRPKEALSDGSNMLQLECLEDLLTKLLKIKHAIT